jgi:hypothetical protein
MKKFPGGFGPASLNRRATISYLTMLTTAAGDQAEPLEVVGRGRPDFRLTGRSRLERGPDGLACPGITTGKLVRSVKYSTSNSRTPVARKRGASVPRPPVERRKVSLPSLSVNAVKWYIAHRSMAGPLRLGTF